MAPQIFAAATYHARCARSLLEILHSLDQGRLAGPASSLNPTLLFGFAPSLTTSPELLTDITSTLTQLYPQHVGCISAPLPHQYLEPGIHSGPHSCSLAYALVNGVSFRSIISGRAEAEVGRWHAGRQRAVDATGAGYVDIERSQTQTISDHSGPDDKVNWQGVWEHTANSVTYSSSSSLGNCRGLEALPDALRNLDPLASHDVLYFSDKAPEGLETALESAFPQANKLSLIASSTPFITGRPVTLFHNGSIFSDGAVGIALARSPSSPPSTMALSFPPLLALSTNLTVTRYLADRPLSEGNLILLLDSGNPTQLLLSAIQKHGLASAHATWVGKDDEFYVGVVDPLSQQLFQLHRINAGDPSRGSIALDAVSAPRTGSIIRLYRLLREPVPDASRYSLDDINSNNISLFVAPEMTPDFENKITDDPAADHDVVVVPGAFLAASENGFTLSCGVQGPWKCNVPGGRVGLSWNPE